ncbi:MAG: cbb3-type cytochrome oxidase assembly protein CcoS [Candidatus Dadabacteria bacterium]|nr:cbb3-type cytochrome oxidase assembly protein CcoS [Candidatus Dadabacteria bacterium]NIQ14876.1 cbb3-type cytochrome oxidase assembly protein CcoS [Candidatus Dadabacteria bacterium]
MEIIYLTLFISLSLAFLFLGIFIWSVIKGQYDDLKTPGYKALIDNEDEKFLKDLKVEEFDNVE